MLTRTGLRRLVGVPRHRLYHVLAVETSCDDTAVCLIDRPASGPPRLIDHRKRSLDNSQTGGIDPSKAHMHHLRELPGLVHEMLADNGMKRADVVCATRGPGMFSNLVAGMNVAKGLAVAWQAPFVPVHHMLGHLLTERFFTNSTSPEFPYYSLLVSGGHTMLVLSRSLFEHEVLCSTMDMALGNALDRCGVLLGVRGATMVGRELERLAAEPAQDHAVSPEYRFPRPLQNRPRRTNVMAWSFAPFISYAQQAEAKYFPNGGYASISHADRRELAVRLQTSLFTHLVDKLELALSNAPDLGKIDFVCSGGVAANKQLRGLLTATLSNRFNVSFPDPQWCTDNALMIGWAGIELYESGQFERDLGCLPVPKWPLDRLLDPPSAYA